MGVGRKQKQLPILVDWYVVKRNRDGSAVDTTWGTSPSWSKAQENITKNMKPDKTYFEEDLFTL